MAPLDSLPRSFFALLAATMLGGLVGCGKPGNGTSYFLAGREPRLDPKHESDWQGVTFAQAHGRTWSNLILNETTSPNHVGFRARYTLAEPEFAVVKASYAWRHTRVPDWMPLSIFGKIAGEKTLLHETRPAGSSGWVAGVFTKSGSQDFPPAELFKRCAWTLPLPGSDAIPVLALSDAEGAILVDVPDHNAPRGCRREEMKNIGGETLNVDAADFESVMRGLANGMRTE